ncbi:MAG TPA: transposase [Myxococcota bacterium]|nr:transposase [Myxococcota bacterium]
MPKKTRKRFTDKQKTNLLGKYHDLHKSGTNAEKAAKKVGVHYNTILKWESKAGKPKVTSAAPKKTTTVQRVQKRRGGKQGIAKTGDIVLVTPDGFRIEGIAPRDLVRVMRELK